MSQVVTVLRDVRERLADPRHWLKRQWCGYITSDGRRLREVPEHVLANCFCLGGALSVSIASLITAPGIYSFTELRSDVERELLTTLDDLGVVDRDTGKPFPVIHLWNDRATTSHADVLTALDKTLQRLSPQAA